MSNSFNSDWTSPCPECVVSRIMAKVPFRARVRESSLGILVIVSHKNSSWKISHLCNQLIIGMGKL